MDKTTIADQLFEVDCKLYALADLLAGLEKGIELGLYEDTPYGLNLIVGDIAQKVAEIKKGVEDPKT
jgi:hypothetical protein